MISLAELGGTAAIRAQAISTVADRRIGIFFDALIKDDKKDLEMIRKDDFWAAVDLEQMVMEQPIGSARKEASPET